MLRSIHSDMKWHPMPAKARLPSGTLVEVLCGQPEQKYGVRLIGDDACTCEASRPLNQSGLGTQHLGNLGIEIEPQQAARSAN